VRGDRTMVGWACMRNRSEEVVVLSPEDAALGPGSNWTAEQSLETRAAKPSAAAANHAVLGTYHFGQVVMQRA
jgi:hypothetical protein